MDTKAWLIEIDRNWEKVVEKDEKAKKEGKLVGRYIDQPYADGKAIYEIVRENKKTVRIHVVMGIGDDWVLPYWGEETTIEKDFALQVLHRRDALTALFAKK